MGLIRGQKAHTMTEHDEARIGLALAKLLRLRAYRHDPDNTTRTWDEPRYKTEWGTKTARGLYLSVLACIRENK